MRLKIRSLETNPNPKLCIYSTSIQHCATHSKQMRNSGHLVSPGTVALILIWIACTRDYCKHPNHNAWWIIVVILRSAEGGVYAPHTPHLCGTVITIGIFRVRVRVSVMTYERLNQQWTSSRLSLVFSCFYSWLHSFDVSVFQLALAVPLYRTCSLLGIRH